MFVLYNNFRRLAIVAIFAAALSIAAWIGAYHFSINPEEISIQHVEIPLINSSLFLFGERKISLLWICITCAIFCSISTLVSLWCVIKRPPQVIITADELSIYLSTPIHWRDIQDIKITKIHGQKFLGIIIKHPEKYFALMPRWKKIAWKLNYRIFGFHLSMGNLAMPIEDALNLLNSYRQQ